jgi:hypothetical protein
MADHHDLIVRRVVTSLEETNDPEALVWQYFDQDRDAVVEAAQQTLEATREDASRDRVEAAVDRELVEALRFPANPPGGIPASLYIHRGRVAALIATVSALTATLTWLLS